MSDPFGVEKKDRESPSGGRYAAAAMWPGLHGAIAGKKGDKLKAAGTEFGSAVVGGAVAPGVGVFPGAMVGTHIAHKKGWLKPQKVKPVKKNLSGHDAFGVEDVSKAFKPPTLKMPKMPGSFMGGGTHKGPGALKQGVQGMGAKVSGAGTKVQVAGNVNSTLMGNQKLGGAQKIAGGGMKKLGGAMQKQPGATLGVAGGAGAVGAGSMLNRKKKPGQV